MNFPRTEEPLFRLLPCEGRDPSFCCSQTRPGLQGGFTLCPCSSSPCPGPALLSGVLGVLEVLCPGAAVPCRRAEGLHAVQGFFATCHRNASDCTERRREMILEALPGHPAPPAGTHPAAACSCGLPWSKKLPLRRGRPRARPLRQQEGKRRAN